MDRLTERDKHGVAVLREGRLTGTLQDNPVARLADYEDTGLTPEEVIELKKEKGGWEFDRTCPNRGEDIDIGWSNCPYCGQRVPAREEAEEQ